jgi:lipid A 3-O-deacylase
VKHSRVRLMSWLAPLCVAAATFCAGAAKAADWSPLSPVPMAIDPADRFELRFGAFAHGVGSVEEGTVDINGEAVTPRLHFGTVAGPWAYLIPRLHAGVNWNTSDRTSFAYTGFLWTLPVWDRLFVEAFVGPAVHNGSLTVTPQLAGLGCDVLFHAGASVGYRLSDNWSIIGTFSHLSNGKTLFGIDCGTNQAAVGSNQGLNNYGVRVGYAF